jgi:hypothetical protein
VNTKTSHRLHCQRQGSCQLNSLLRSIDVLHGLQPDRGIRHEGSLKWLKSLSINCKLGRKSQPYWYLDIYVTDKLPSPPWARMSTQNKRDGVQGRKFYSIFPSRTQVLGDPARYRNCQKRSYIYSTTDSPHLRLFPFLGFPDAVTTSFSRVSFLIILLPPVRQPS